MRPRAPVQNQQTMELISAQKASHKLNDFVSLQQPQGSNGGGGGGGGGGKPGGGPGGGGRGTGTLVTMDRFDQEVSMMQTSLHQLQVQQENFMQTYKRDMDGIQTLLKQMVSSAPGIDCSSKSVVRGWVRMCVCMYVYMCVHACVCVGGMCVCVCAWVCVCVCV